MASLTCVVYHGFTINQSLQVPPPPLPQPYPPLPTFFYPTQNYHVYSSLFYLGHNTWIEIQVDTIASPVDLNCPVLEAELRHPIMQLYLLSLHL